MFLHHIANYHALLHHMLHGVYFVNGQFFGF